MVKKVREYLSLCERSRSGAPGEGLTEASIAEFKMHHLFLLSVTLQFGNPENPLTRRYAATSPIRGEVIIFLINQFYFLNRLFRVDDAIEKRENA